MGMHIDLLGRISVSPALNPAETEYLLALAYAGPARSGPDPFAVPNHPKLEVLLRKGKHDIPGGRPRSTQPPMGCGWAPCLHGCCLSWSGVEKFYHPADWLRFLVDHLLGPDARAIGARSADLAGFTFDHRLDGVVAVSCAQTEEFWLVVVRDNDITEVLLSRGEAQEGFWPSLPLSARPLDPLSPDTYVDGAVRRRIDGVRYSLREVTA